MDQGINLYNDKFAKPAKVAMDQLLAMKKLTPTPRRKDRMDLL